MQDYPLNQHKWDWATLMQWTDFHSIPRNTAKEKMCVHLKEAPSAMEQDVRTPIQMGQCPGRLWVILTT